MNYTEALMQMAQIRNMFSHWKWEHEDGKTNATERVWLKHLYRYDVNIADQALDNVYAYGKADFQRQLLPAFIREADRLVKQHEPEKKTTIRRPTRIYIFEDEDDPDWKIKVTCPWGVPSNTEAMEKEGRELQVKVSLLYKRNVKFIRQWEIPPEQEIEVTEEELLKWMNDELHKDEDLKDCRFDGVFRWMSPDPSGCNWSPRGLSSSGSPVAVCRERADRVTEEAQKRFNLK